MIAFALGLSFASFLIVLRNEGRSARFRAQVHATLRHHCSVQEALIEAYDQNCLDIEKLETRSRL